LFHSANEQRLAASAPAGYTHGNGERSGSVATKNIKDMSEEEFRHLIRESVREALQVYVQKIEKEDVDWEAAAEAVLERLDKAWERLTSE
jgi:hypothetical protein